MWRVVSLFSILIIGGGGFWPLMMIRWYCFLMKITVCKVSFTCHRGLISPLALLGFATSQQHRIVSVMSQWWVWANVKVADNMFKSNSEFRIPFTCFTLIWISYSCVSFSLSFLPWSFFLFNCPFCSTFLFLFLSWSSRCSNLAITLAITFCWKKSPGRGTDSCDPN